MQEYVGTFLLRKSPECVEGFSFLRLCVNTLSLLEFYHISFQLLDLKQKAGLGQNVVWNSADDMADVSGKKGFRES
jgi:hypothetical protein